MVGGLMVGGLMVGGLMRGVPGSLLRGCALLLGGAALLGCSGSPAEDLGGRWSGELTFVQNNQERTLPVVLQLEQTDHRLSGFLQAMELGGQEGAMSGRRFELIEGLAADGQVFFHARAQLAIGTATISFTGRAGDAEGTRLSGETRIDLSTTEGSADLPGRLEVEREKGKP